MILPLVSMGYANFGRTVMFEFLWAIGPWCLIEATFLRFIRWPAVFSVSTSLTFDSAYCCCCRTFQSFPVERLFQGKSGWIDDAFDWSTPTWFNKAILFAFNDIKYSDINWQVFGEVTTWPALYLSTEPLAQVRPHSLVQYSVHSFFNLFVFQVATFIFLFVWNSVFKDFPLPRNPSTKSKVFDTIAFYIDYQHLIIN